MTAPVPAKTGDVVHLFNSLLSAAWYGVVCDEDTPQMMSATLEAVQGEAVITTPVLVGRQGEPGKNAPIVELEFIDGLETFEDATTLLPNWDESMSNHGVWLVDNKDNPTKSLVYIWDGAKWNKVLPGPSGPVGRTPNLSFEFETIPLSERESNPQITDQVIVSGDVNNPHVKIRGLSPQGPAGPAAAINDALDYNKNLTKHVGDVLTVLDDGNGGAGKWGPSQMTLKQARLYTIPEGAFTNTPNFIGIGPTDFSIGTYVIPAQPFNWIPYVTGHIRATGLELDDDPTQIGCLVKVAVEASGELDGNVVARGKGNSSRETHILPHFSSSGDPNRAVAPGNAVGVVKAGVQVRVNIILHNDGLASWYSFNRNDAQLSVLVIPETGSDDVYEIK